MPPLQSPVVTKVRSGAAEKPSEAILKGIEKHMQEAMPIVQRTIEADYSDEEGRVKAVEFLKRLMAEVVNWLSYEESVVVAEQLFCEC